MSIAWIEALKREFPSSHLLESQQDLLERSYDWWPVAAKWRQQGRQPYSPQVVARPVSVAEIAHLLAWASRNGVPVTPWGAGSGVTGAALPLHGGICLDTSAMTRILALDQQNLLVKVEAGLMGHHLEETLNRAGYTLNHSPQSLERSTVGGWVATRATGQFSSRWGGIEDLLAALTVVLTDGAIVRTQLAPRAATGPDLKQLFVGSEGTLGVVAEVTLKIFPLPEARLFESFVFADLENGLTAMRRMVQAGLRPFLLRLYDRDEAAHLLHDSNPPGNVLLLGAEGLRQVADAELHACLEICKEAGGATLGPRLVEDWMARRYDFSTIENTLALPGGVAETIEVAHFWSDITPTYNALKQRLRPFAERVMGHFSHVYPQGTSLYMIMLGKAEDAVQAEETLMRIWETSMNTCLEVGAAISHHHGVGLARLPYIRRQLDSAFPLLERIKACLDPADVLNPGKFDLTPPAEEAD